MQEPAPQETKKKNWNPDDWLALFGVTVIGALTRFFRLGMPDRLTFDETYYAKEACRYVGFSKDFCEWPKSPPAEVHPPLAKWLIGIGVKIGGFDAVAWRLAAAFFGVVAVVLLYLLARKLLGSITGALVAAGLLAFDPLHFVHSRSALLDIFTATFSLAAFLFLAYDRDAMQRESETGVRRRWWAHPWRLAAGLAAGAATASKWSGGLTLLGIIVLTVVWELARRKQDGWIKALGRTLRQEAPSMVLFLGLLPFAFYVATYISRLQGPVLDPLAEGSWASEWLRYQTNALDFHRNVASHHGFESPPWSWVLIKRPLLYFAQESDDQRASVYAMGNPFIWWPSLLALGYMFIAWIRKRDWTRPEGFVLMGFAFTYLIWLVLAPRRDAVFLFYLLPALPFMHLGIAYVIANVARGLTQKIALGVAVIFSVGWFFLYYPVIGFVPISQGRWDNQMFLQSCGVAHARVTVTNTVTQAVNRETTIARTRTHTSIDKDIPPKGWCWK